MPNKIISFFHSNIFLITSCTLIFAFSIWLRSIADIGPDTGVYIEIGKKIAGGGRYYYEFFESNFPISFYFYALQYKIAEFTNINPIILSEIFVNFLGLFSIIFSGHILKKTTIYDNKVHYNLIILSYFVGFFLRYQGLFINEFGTKTSFLLILFYPYLSYSFQRTKPFSTKDLICRGLLMGLIPCFKPHYIVLIIAIESFKFWQEKNLKFFFELDKLLMALIGSLYLFLMVKFTPEFFEFIIPMWSKYYGPYQAFQNFISNSLERFITCLSFVFIFLIFGRFKPSYNDKILIISFTGATLLLVLENLGSLDQTSIFYSICTISIFKLSYDFFSSKELDLSNNNLLIITTIFLPIFDYKNVTNLFFTGGIATLCWLIFITAPFIFSKFQKQKIFSKNNVLKSLIHAALLIPIIMMPTKLMNLSYIFFGYLISFRTLLEYEKQQKVKHFSKLLIFLIAAAFSLTVTNYIFVIKENLAKESKSLSPNKYSDGLNYYLKKYASKSEDKFLVFSNLILDRYPIGNYSKKENDSMQYIVVGNSNLIPPQTNLLFAINDPDYTFTFSYFLADTIKQMKDPNTKVLFINNSRYLLNEDKKCKIPLLEYNFLSPAFKNIFLQNFHYENTIIITKTKQQKPAIFIEKDLRKYYDSEKKDQKIISYEFEVYVRK